MFSEKSYRNLKISDQSLMKIRTDLLNDQPILLSSQDFQDLELQKDSSGCYSTANKQDFQRIRVCVTESVLTFSEERSGQSLRSVYLRKDLAKTSNPHVTLETPKDYSLEDLLNKVQQMNFDSRNQLAQLQGAKANMRLHYLNLLPHLSFGSGLTVSTLDPIGWISAIGDLMPFLLPSRWAQASEASHLYKAQQIGVATLREDAMQITEGLVSQVVADNENVRMIQQVIQTTAASVEQIKNLEKIGKLQPGRYRDLASTLKGLEELKSSLELSCSSDLIELAYAIGFKNPLAIRSITMSAPNMDHAQELTLTDSAQQKVLISAHELLQMDEMILAAKANMTERMFEWMDPAADPQAGIGLGLPSYVKIGASSVSSLKIQKEQMSAQLLNKLAHAYDDYNNALKNYQQMNDGVQLQLARIQVAKDEMNQNPNDTPVGELQDAYTQLAGQMMGSSSNKFGAYSNLSLINRLLHQGIYQK